MLLKLSSISLHSAAMLLKLSNISSILPPCFLDYPAFLHGSFPSFTSMAHGCEHFIIIKDKKIAQKSRGLRLFAPFFRMFFQIPGAFFLKALRSTFQISGQG
jgi:hypothetical protein